VYGHSLGSLVGGPRDFTVSVEAPSGSWQQVASVAGDFYYPAVLATFPAVQAQAVQVSVQVANYGGYAGGGVPSFWANSQTLEMQVHSLQVYAASQTSSPPAPSPTPPTTAPATTAPSATSPTTAAQSLPLSYPVFPGVGLSDPTSPVGGTPATTASASPGPTTTTAPRAPITRSRPPLTLPLPNGPLAPPSPGQGTTPDGKGYWLVAAGGGVYAFGDAHYYGSPQGRHLKLASKVVGI